MGNVFNTVQVRKPSRSVFNLSHDVKYAMKMGVLTPTLIEEVIPGDSFTIQAENLTRFAPLTAPVMHNIREYTHYFFVPNRLVFPLFKDFISPDLSKTIPPAWPYINLFDVEVGSLMDYLGYPTGSWDGGVQASAIPLAAYQLVWNEYYRDQNLQDEVDYTLTAGENDSNSDLYTLRRRAWQHDYFTANLPFAQKGPAVSLPLLDAQTDIAVYRNVTSGGTASWTNDQSGTGDTIVYNKESTDPNPNILNGGLYAEGSEVNANAASINDLRVAFRLQEFFEKAARGGTRYIEQIKMHFDVNSSDARLQRPEFLGGATTSIVISEVLQTSASDEVTPQANMAGHAISGMRGKKVRYFAEEHGYIIGIKSVMPSTAYSQGLPRHLSRTTWQDYAWPTFAHLGEQPVLNKEIYLDPNDGEDDDTFGYIPRYSEYRYSPSRIAGEFRTTLDHWHFGRFFENRPRLNAEFIECVPTNHPFAVEEQNENLWCHTFNKVFVKRKLPKYGTPTL